MGVNRGYTTGRKGQGPRTKPKRCLCPNCGKKGLTLWKPTPYGVLNRGCQYCQHQENRPI